GQAQERARDGAGGEAEEHALEAERGVLPERAALVAVLEKIDEAGPQQTRTRQEEITHQSGCGHAHPQGGDQRQDGDGDPAVAPKAEPRHPYSTPRQWTSAPSTARTSLLRRTPMIPSRRTPRMITSLRRKRLAEKTIQPRPSVAAISSAATTVEKATASA